MPTQTPIYWGRTEMSFGPRFRLIALMPNLFKVYRETPWFIDRDKAERRGGFPYSIYASGMSASGSAKRFSRHKKLVDAQAAAIDLAELDAERVESVLIGNRLVLVGDRVTSLEAPSGFYMSAPLAGHIASLTTGQRCTVLWDGQDEPATYRLSLLKTLEQRDVKAA